MGSNLNIKVVNATKWSSITEIIAKLISPISTMILARLLAPDAFGVLITAQMVISFAEIFTDAGFQKYIIQHDFLNEDEKYKSVTVAFWANFIMSMTIWLVLSLFANPIARLVGCEGNGLVIAISCVCLPLAAFSSIQMALFKRDLDFKTLFNVRLVGIFIPLVITVPLAYLTKSYWALIIGMIALYLANAVILTIKSNWKPYWYFDLQCFKDMFSFTIWSMLEAISIWLTSYIDIFLVGTLLNQHYLGLYRTSMSTVGQITSIITSATTPVLFSSLARLQNNRVEFNQLFFKFQKLVSILIIPLGVGIFLFSDLITEILLGSQWMEASAFIGMWGLTSSISIVLGHYASEVYRSIGKPKLSVIAQWLHIIMLCPIVLLFINKGFDILCIARSLVRLQLVIVQLFIMGVIVKMNVLKMFTNIIPAIIASASMLFVLLLPETNNIFIKFLYIILCICIYFIVLIIFPKERYICLNLKSILKRK